jgi:hypothetical protein
MSGTNQGGVTAENTSGTKKAFGQRSQSESLGSFVMEDNVSQNS